MCDVTTVAGTGGRRFEFQKQRYTLLDGCFSAPSFPDKQPLVDYCKSKGLTKEDAEAKLATYGQNTFDVPIPTFGELFKSHAVSLPSGGHRV